MDEKHGKSGNGRVEDRSLILDGTPEQQFQFMQAFIAEYREKYGEIPDEEDDETT